MTTMCKECGLGRSFGVDHDHSTEAVQKDRIATERLNAQIAIQRENAEWIKEYQARTGEAF